MPRKNIFSEYFNFSLLYKWLNWYLLGISGLGRCISSLSWCWSETSYLVHLFIISFHFIQFMVIGSGLVDKWLIFDVFFPLRVDHVRVWRNFAGLWLVDVKWNNIRESISLIQSSIKCSWHESITVIVSSSLWEFCGWRLVVNLSTVHWMGFPIQWNLSSEKPTCISVSIGISWSTKDISSTGITSCTLRLFIGIALSSFKNLHDRVSSFPLNFYGCFGFYNFCSDFLSWRSSWLATRFDLIFIRKFLYMKDGICILLYVFYSWMHSDSPFLFY